MSKFDFVRITNGHTFDTGQNYILSFTKTRGRRVKNGGRKNNHTHTHAHITNQLRRYKQSQEIEQRMAHRMIQHYDQKCMRKVPNLAVMKVAYQLLLPAPSSLQ